jgi:hypothetical protein
MDVLYGRLRFCKRDSLWQRRYGCTLIFGPVQSLSLLAPMKCAIPSRSELLCHHFDVYPRRCGRVAKQHGHGVEVMLRMYAAWIEGATEADIHAIKKEMEKRPVARAAFFDSRTAISAVSAATNRVTQIAIRPLKSPEFGSSLAVGKDLSDSSLRNDKKIKWRRGWDSNPRAGITRPSDFESAPL